MQVGIATDVTAVNRERQLFRKHGWFFDHLHVVVHSGVFRFWTIHGLIKIWV